MAKKPVINDDIRRMYSYLTNELGNDVGAAAIMGCLFWRSGIDPKYLDPKWRRKNDGISVDEYLKITKENDFARDGAGFGIARWKTWTAKTNLVNYAKQSRKPLDDFEMQMEFLWDDLNGHIRYEFTRKQLKTSKNLSDNCYVFLKDYIEPKVTEDKLEEIAHKAGDYGAFYQHELYVKPEKKEDYFEKNERVPRHYAFIMAPTVIIRKRPRFLSRSIARPAVYEERYPFIEYSEDCKWIAILVCGKDGKPAIGWIRDKDCLVMTEIVSKADKIQTDRAIREALG